MSGHLSLAAAQEYYADPDALHLDKKIKDALPDAADKPQTPCGRTRLWAQTHREEPQQVFDPLDHHLSAEPRLLRRAVAEQCALDGVFVSDD